VHTRWACTHLPIVQLHLNAGPGFFPGAALPNLCGVWRQRPSFEDGRKVALMMKLCLPGFYAQHTVILIQTKVRGS